MKKAIKTLLGALLFSSGLYRVLLGKRAVIVAFHRVDDRLNDALTVSQNDFRRYCEFFSRYFEVIALPELLVRLRDGRSIAGCLVITFDDGYLDNYVNAAPVLKRMRLPACFFIATGFIASNVIPWWDRKNPIKPEWMSWEQVRTLSEWGFDLGPHTVNHVDLGKVEGEEATTEISASRQRLETELGRKADLFAYPYGRINQMSDRNREYIRANGFACCMSCCGGLVSPEDDPFHIRREPINNWFASPYQFGFELVMQQA